jgi:hypothetical protein
MRNLEASAALRRVIVAGVSAAALVGIGVGTASAAEPVVKGCFGQSVSADAQALHPYGQLVLNPNAPRNPFGTVADAVHGVQAGQVPDAVFPNTCN